ncbi:MAG: acyl-CoA dehydrogenase family protein, partial [Myxococcales bacterium]|nr:acyl-CoA dehydrogenase family protein [Myxococcales bacterium]
MDFELPEQHRILRASVREFCEREIRPRARAWDAEERFPMEIVPQLAELGLLGIRIPEEYGGAAMDTLAYAICVEECARVDGSLALTVASHNGLGTGHILAFGNDEQKQKYLPKAASGEWLAAWGLTEPGSGSDSAALQTTAV